MDVGHMSKTRLYLVGVLVAVALCFVAWGGIVVAEPPKVMEPFGPATVNGVPVLSTDSITAWCGGVLNATAYIYGSTYYFALDQSITGDDPDVAGRQGCYITETITFRLMRGSQLAWASQTLPWTPGYGSELPLTFPPLAVNLTSLTASSRLGKVAVKWETATETDVLGFNVYRGAKADAMELGLAVKANDRLIAGEAAAPGLGAKYAFTDSILKAGGASFYWVEIVNASGGTTVFGPVSAVQDVADVTE